MTTIQKWQGLACTLALACGIAGCGGGGGGDDASCDGPSCVGSSGIGVGELGATYQVRSDGDATRAEATFKFGEEDDTTGNVRLDDSDSVRVVTADGTQDLVRDPDAEINAYGKRRHTYVAELQTPTDALPVTFEFVRDGATYTSHLTLPRPFTVTAPSKLPVDARQLRVHASNPREAAGIWHEASYVCTGSDGKESRAAHQPVREVEGSLGADGEGESYTLDLSAAVPATGTQRRCDVEILVERRNLSNDSESAYSYLITLGTQERKLRLRLE